MQNATSLVGARNFSLLLLFVLLLLGTLRTCYRTVTNVTTTPAATVTPPPRDPSAPGIATLSLSQAPEYVRRMVDYLKSVRHLSPLKGFRGGRLFRNREGRLPSGKTYYEFDVHPTTTGVSRGAERLVVDQEKSVFYYTRDHYSTFLKLD